MKLLLIIIGVLVGVGIGIFISYTLLKNQLTKAGREALKKAEEDGELIKKEKILQAKEKFLQLKAEHEKSCNEKNQQISAAENRIKQKENSLSQKLEELNRKTNENAAQKENLNKQMAAVSQKQKELEEQIASQKNKLESIVTEYIKEYKESVKEQGFTFFEIIVDEEEKRKPKYKTFSSALTHGKKKQGVFGNIHCVFNPDIVKILYNVRQAEKYNPNKTKNYDKRVFNDITMLKDEELQEKIYNLFNEQALRIEAMYEEKG